MRVFVGYGYNQKDQWIEDHVFPILKCMGFVVVHGKQMEGEEIDDEVKSRINQSDAVVGFFTIRDGQGDADYTSHIWIRDEVVYAVGKEKLIVPIKEVGVKMPDAILGNRQSIPLDQTDRLACVAALAETLGRRNIRRIRLEPQGDALTQEIHQLRRDPGFTIRYRTRNHDNDIDSDFRDGRLELVDYGFYLNVADVPRRGYVDVEGLLNGVQRFSSGWASADAVMVKIN
jgi:hypothetical protein